MKERLDPITHEDPAYARGWNDALARDPCAPGEAHRYRIECERCGQPGTLHVSVEPQNAALDETAAFAVEAGLDHVDRFDCWCGPSKDYEDPATGNQVWLHREVVS